jgi:hypothetical protein
MELQIQHLVLLQKLEFKGLRRKSFFVFAFGSTTKPGTEMVVESYPSPAKTTRCNGTKERRRFSNGLQIFKKSTFKSSIPE